LGAASVSPGQDVKGTSWQAEQIIEGVLGAGCKEAIDLAGPGDRPLLMGTECDSLGDEKLSFTKLFGYFARDVVDFVNF
jgi:hypothetical protein